jgi:hypothetical protein
MVRSLKDLRKQITLLDGRIAKTYQKAQYLDRQARSLTSNRSIPPSKKNKVVNALFRKSDDEMDEMATMIRVRDRLSNILMELEDSGIDTGRSITPERQMELLLRRTFG